MHKSKLLAVINTFSKAFYDLALSYLSNLAIFHPRMVQYAGAVHQKCGIVLNIWGFIDGTLCCIQCPTYHQKRLYSGYKQMHGIKFQSITMPDGLIANLYGPMNGNCHDSFMYGQSGILAQLNHWMPCDNGTIIYSYMATPHIHGVYTYLVVSKIHLLDLQKHNGMQECHLFM